MCESALARAEGPNSAWTCFVNQSFFGLRTWSEHLCCSRSIGTSSRQGQAWGTYSFRASLQVKLPVELLIHGVFCPAFTYLWARVNTWVIWVREEPEFCQYVSPGAMACLPFIFISVYLKIPGLDTFGFVYCGNTRNFMPWITAINISNE